MDQKKWIGIRDSYMGCSPTINYVNSRSPFLAVFESAAGSALSFKVIKVLSLAFRGTFYSRLFAFVHFRLGWQRQRFTELGTALEVLRRRFLGDRECSASHVIVVSRFGYKTIPLPRIVGESKGTASHPCIAIGRTCRRGTICNQPSLLCLLSAL